METVFYLFLNKQNACLMKMLTRACNDMREVDTFVNANAIAKDQIVNILQVKDGTFLLIYYE